jgi:hypothetical protein
MTCEDCGERIYNRHCVNCHEEVFIAEQHRELGTYGETSDEFQDTVERQLVNPSIPERS